MSTGWHAHAKNTRFYVGEVVYWLFDSRAQDAVAAVIDAEGNLTEPPNRLTVFKKDGSCDLCER